ncbi:MAG: hypothetical protein CV087_23005 [Candidatus Brocadia sp. WS118]|nr:MAG: hypothetical protein CV087_23005 [Candidatus Brocadia sp. WS118]
MSEQEEKEIDYISYLSRIWNREDLAKQISILDKEFYLRYNEFMDSPNYSTHEKEQHQIRFNSFFHKRWEFIGKCAATTSLTNKFENQLTHEETIIYKQINELVSNFRENIKKI